jgi:hypothetical protein
MMPIQSILITKMLSINGKTSYEGKKVDLDQEIEIERSRNRESRNRESRNRGQEIESQEVGTLAFGKEDRRKMKERERNRKERARMLIVNYQG